MDWNIKSSSKSGRHESQRSQGVFHTADHAIRKALQTALYISKCRENYRDLVGHFSYEVIWSPPCK